MQNEKEVLSLNETLSSRYAQFVKMREYLANSNDGGDTLARDISKALFLSRVIMQTLEKSMVEVLRGLNPHG